MKKISLQALEANLRDALVMLKQSGEALAVMDGDVELVRLQAAAEDRPTYPQEELRGTVDEIGDVIAPIWEELES